MNGAGLVGIIESKRKSLANPKAAVTIKTILEIKVNLTSCNQETETDTITWNRKIFATDAHSLAMPKSCEIGTIFTIEFSSIPDHERYSTALL